jgi:hypothetical protein
MLLGGFCAFLLGTLFKFRLLPFLKADMIMSGGREIPTSDFAAFFARCFFVFGSACVMVSLLWLAVVRRKKKS